MSGSPRFEPRVALIVAAIVAAYAAVTLGTARVTVDDYLLLVSDYLKMAAGLWLSALFIAMCVVLYIHRPRTGKPARSPVAVLSSALHDRWARDRFLSLMLPPLMFATLMATFNTFKQGVLSQAGFGFDPALVELDRLLFLGHDPWRVTHAIFSSPWATMAIDKAYHGWFLPMSIGLVWCSFLSPAHDRLRIRYVFSFLGVWILIGSVMAISMPSAGPIFQPTSIGLVHGFEPLATRLYGQQAWLAAHANGAGIAALDFQRLLLETHRGDTLAIGGGISAMPSVHNALAALFALAAFQINRVFGIVLGGYALLIWIGSIHLGWHYAADGPVAIAATYMIWRASGTMADLLMTGRQTAFARPA